VETHKEKNFTIKKNELKKDFIAFDNQSINIDIFKLNNLDFLQSLSNRSLKKWFDKISLISLQIDPFIIAQNPEAELSRIDSKLSELIYQLKLEKTFANPFDFTNKILSTLDKLENLIKERNS